MVDEAVELLPFDEGFVTDEYLAWLNDADLMRYSGQRLVRHDRETALRYVESFRGTRNHFWAVQRRRDAVCVGTMTAYVDSRNAVADMGLLIGHPHARGKGLGRSAWGIGLRYLFEVEGMRKVTGGTSVLNRAMIRIFEHWRMVLEGTRREQEMIGDRPSDILLFGILRAEWDNRAR